MNRIRTHNISGDRHWGTDYKGRCKSNYNTITTTTTTTPDKFNHCPLDHNMDILFYMIHTFVSSQIKLMVQIIQLQF
jgi:hypothetical protein